MDNISSINYNNANYDLAAMSAATATANTGAVDNIAASGEATEASESIGLDSEYFTDSTALSEEASSQTATEGAEAAEGAEGAEAAEGAEGAEESEDTEAAEEGEEANATTEEAGQEGAAQVAPDATTIATNYLTENYGDELSDTEIDNIVSENVSSSTTLDDTFTADLDTYAEEAINGTDEQAAEVAEEEDSTF